ncbi:MAG: galactokinase family protein [Caldilineaceae bacterium]
MSQPNSSLHQARPQAERVEQLITQLQRRYGVDPTTIRVVRAPLRISPLGAHIDHQLGRVTGMAVDRSILFAFAPTQDGSVHVESLDFANTTDFSLTQVPVYAKGDWGNYLRGAVVALQRGYVLHQGLVGVLGGDMPIGGLSSSAAVTIAYLLALEVVNDLSISADENIRLVTRTEHEYIGLNNGILDQTSILFSRRSHLTVIDCQTVAIERAPSQIDPAAYAIMAVYSGVAQGLVGTGYNNRVAECQSAAQQLLALAGQPAHADPRLRHVAPTIFADYGSRLEGPLRKRATHFFTEMARVAAGEAAWREGDLVRFGQLVSQSGESSIKNYESGCPQLITLYEILNDTPGVYGVRFSGAGFRGSCLALVDPKASAAIAEAVHRRYPQTHPDIADQYSVHLCLPADGAHLLGNS